MPPKVKVTKEDIVSAAVDIVREGGAAGLNARAIAAKLGCSTQPIFSNYDAMDELKADVIKAANELYGQYLAREIALGEYPPYKASGIGYIRFSKEEKELFKLLFMRDRTGEEPKKADEFDGIVELIQKSIGLSYEEASMFHLEMWVMVHGIATMLATDYLQWDFDMISKMLTDFYEGLKYRFTSKGGGK